MAELKQIQVCF